MAIDLLVVEALVGIDFEEATEHVTRFLGDIILEGVDSSENEAVQFVHTGSLERHCAVQHCVEDYSCAPEVNAKAVSVLIPENLRRNVGGCAALVAHLDTWRALLADSKVGDLNLTLAIEQYVVEFDVAMGNVLRVNVLEAIDYLLEDLLRDWLLQATPLPDVVEKVATRAQLHHDDYVFLRLDCLVDLDHVVMAELEQKVHLFHQLLLLYLVGQAFLIQGFQSNQLSH